jgi:hypothetical protein
VAEVTPKACDMPARSARNVFNALRSSQPQNVFDDDFLLNTNISSSMREVFVTGDIEVLPTNPRSEGLPLIPCSRRP